MSGYVKPIKGKRDFTEGPLFWRIFLFALPIMATGILQILYNMADNIVVGQFSGDPDALGAVGSTSSLTNLVLNLLLGCAGGTGVVVSQAFGAKNNEMVSKAVHTALLFSFFGGLLFMGIGLGVSRPALVLMKTKPYLLEKALLYFRIICLGIPASAVYNYGAAILRSVGNSKAPLAILATTGLVNVAMNFLFVLGFGMAVEGVAIATIVAQYLSAIAVVFLLWREGDQPYGFHPRRLRLDLPLLKRILRLGVPAGLQGSMFSLANITLTGAINSLGDHVIKAYTITNNIDAITFTACNSFHQAAMTFTGQNYGAKKYDRMRKVALFCLLQVAFVGILVGQVELLFSRQLSMLYVAADDPNREEILRLAADMMRVLLTTYFTCGIMDVLSGILKGLGYALPPMLISLLCICGLRLAWVNFVFPLEKFHSHIGLCYCFPISWVLALLAFGGLLIFAWVRIQKKSTHG